jgi:3-dehydroquinate dehydratase type I
MICVSIPEMAQLPGALAQGAELVEFRFDLIRKSPEQVYKELPEPVRSVATCRPGPYGDQERIRILRKAMDLGATYVDIEIDTNEEVIAELRDYAGKLNRSLIVSHHDFNTTPEKADLVSILGRCYSLGGDVAKITTLVNSREELVRLLSLYEYGGKKVIIGMGPQGILSRIVAPYLGSEFTFASTGGGNETAPGQLSFDRIKKIFNSIETP